MSVDILEWWQKSYDVWEMVWELWNALAVSIVKCSSCSMNIFVSLLQMIFAVTPLLVIVYVLHPSHRLITNSANSPFVLILIAASSPIFSLRITSFCNVYSTVIVQAIHPCSIKHVCPRAITSKYPDAFAF